MRWSDVGKRYGLEIRRAVEADAPGIAELLACLGYTITPASLAVQLETLRHGNSAVLLALEWGPPSGLIGLHWHHTVIAERPVAQIDTLFVDPEARRRGIGRLLVKAGAQVARQAGCDSLRLFVEPDQGELEAFAAATGFAAGAMLLDRPLRKGGHARG